MIDQLKKSAEAATPGPWMHLQGDRSVYDRMNDGCRGNSIVGVDYAPPFYEIESKNLDYVAAANPQAILRLIAVAEKLAEALYGLMADCDTSDDCQYGTIATKHVRKSVDPALTAWEELK